jgi:hypothetical protein
MVYEIEEPNLSRCSANLIGDRLTIFEFVTPDPGCIDRGDNIEFSRLVGTKAEDLSIL